jgi:hypothetical protein
MSHGDHSDHKKRLDLVREASKLEGKEIAALADLQGPKIRVGIFGNGPVSLVNGQNFTITTDDIAGDKEKVSTTYKGLPGDVKKGDPILVDDGKIRLEVVEVKGNNVITKVIEGGTISNSKGLNLPGVAVNVPAMSDKDEEDEGYFKIVATGYDEELQREQIQIHGGENANIFLIKNEEGFIVDVYGQQDLVESMTIWESDIEPEEEDDEEDETAKKERLIKYIMENQYNTDDPKNDASNEKYLESLSIEELESKIF